MVTRTRLDVALIRTVPVFFCGEIYLTSTDHKAPHYVFFYTAMSPRPFLGPNILLSTIFSYTLSLRSSLSEKDQVSHSYKTTGKITVLYIFGQQTGRQKILYRKFARIPWLQTALNFFMNHPNYIGTKSRFYVTKNSPCSLVRPNGRCCFGN
jgi:hypothetical protein